MPDCSITPSPYTQAPRRSHVACSSSPASPRTCVAGRSAQELAHAQGPWKRGASELPWWESPLQLHLVLPVVCTDALTSFS